MTPLYLDPPQKAALRKLSDRTRIPMAVYLREAVDMLIAKYKAKGDER
jgi:predicted DNA-binding protein